MLGWQFDARQGTVFVTSLVLYVLRNVCSCVSSITGDSVYDLLTQRWVFAFDRSSFAKGGAVLAELVLDVREDSSERADLLNI
jgi:hypothetical protein